MFKWCLLFNGIKAPPKRDRVQEVDSRRFYANFESASHAFPITWAPQQKGVDFRRNLASKGRARPAKTVAAVPRKRTQYNFFFLT